MKRLFVHGSGPRGGMLVDEHGQDWDGKVETAREMAHKEARAAINQGGGWSEDWMGWIWEAMQVNDDDEEVLVASVRVMDDRDETS